MIIPCDDVVCWLRSRDISDDVARYCDGTTGENQKTNRGFIQRNNNDWIVAYLGHMRPFVIASPFLVCNVLISFSIMIFFAFICSTLCLVDSISMNSLRHIILQYRVIHCLLDSLVP
eukprot:424836_1